MEGKGCSFTGHRMIEEKYRDKLILLLDRAVEYAYAEGCRFFYAGGAVGFDTLAARAVIRFKMTHPDVSLVLILPCINQDDYWNSSDIDRYNFIVSMANEVRYVSDEYTKSCMKKRNMALAEACDIMIAFVGRARSGSGQTVRMAESMGKKVYNLYPKVVMTDNL